MGAKQQAYKTLAKTMIQNFSKRWVQNSKLTKLLQRQ